MGASAVIRFGEALQLLERRIGLKNAEPLQPLFMHAYTAAHATVPGLPQAPHVRADMV